ncbi:MAG: DUF3520 domain-containing protein, partial [Proteobacteria bacterium]|nr:DUF3520 domain-containing protein [Pseudomonadota bacterium]
YDYPEPDTDSFGVYLEAAPHPWQSSHHLLRVGIDTLSSTPQIRGRRATEPGGPGVNLEYRKPLHLTFLVDTSGSMQSDDKSGLVVRSLEYLVTQLNEEDTIAIATYAGATRQVLLPTSASEQTTIVAALKSLQSGGGTAMNSGMELAYRMASDEYVSGHENRVIVLSDGDANIGRSSHEEILSSISTYAGQGITMTTVGFGMGNYQDTMMEQLANKGDGNYYYIDSYSEAKKVFGTDLAGTVQTVARDVKIQVEFHEEAVISYRLVGYENRDIADKDFRNDKVDAGEIGTGHQVTALYNVILRDDPTGDMATVRIRHKKPGPEQPAVEQSVAFPAAAVHLEFQEASPSFRLAFGVASFSELLRGSRYSDEVSYGDVATIVQNAASPDSAQQAELLALIQKAGALSGEAVAVSFRPENN